MLGAANLVLKFLPLPVIPVVALTIVDYAIQRLSHGLIAIAGLHDELK